MRCEIPELGRCCFCFPLRFGLIIWGYAKLIASVVLLTCMLLSLANDWEHYFYSVNIPYTIIYMIIIGSVAADIIFHIIFAIGAHQKDHKKMDLFYKFCIYILVLYIAGLCISIVYGVYENHMFAFFFGFTLGAVSFCCIIIQIYIIILVRSEVMKLKRGSNFEFINHGADANMNVKLDLNSAVVH